MSSQAPARAVVLDDLAAADRERWNAIAVDVPAARFELLRATDGEQPHGGVRYCAVESERGYLAIARAAAPLSAGKRLDFALYGRAARTAARLGLGMGDAITCGWPFSHGHNMVADGRLPDSAQARSLHAICEALESSAGNRPLVVPDVVAENVVLRSVLAARGYGVAGSRPIAYFDIEWTTFDGYLALLKRQSKNRYDNVRFEIKRYRRSGAVIERLTSATAAEWELICGLLNRHHERLNGHSPGHDAMQMQRCAEALGDDFLVFVSRRHGVIDGAAVGTQSGSHASLLWVGVDYAATGNNFTYFNLAFYAPIDHCTRSGIKRLWLGNAAYDAKIRRGARLMPAYIYVRAPTALRRAAYRPLLALQRAWYLRKFGHYLNTAAQ